MKQIILLVLTSTIVHVCVACTQPRFKDGAENFFRIEPDFQKVRIVLPANTDIHDIIDCIDSDRKQLKFRLRYQFRGEWQVLKFVSEDLFDSLKERFLEISGRGCETVEKMKIKGGKEIDGEINFGGPVKFGPRKVLRSMDLLFLSSDSVTFSWANESVECATGFKVDVSRKSDQRDLGPLFLSNEDYLPLHWSGLQSCQRYILQVSPIFNHKTGEPTTVEFSTFPNVTLLDVKVLGNGIEYNMAKLENCDSFAYSEFRMAVTGSHFDGEVSATLKVRTEFWEEIDKSVQSFSIEDFRRELVALGILVNCASYSIDVIAEIEDNKNFKTDVPLVVNMTAYTDNNMNLQLSDKALCGRSGRMVDDAHDYSEPPSTSHDDNYDDDFDNPDNDTTSATLSQLEKVSKAGSSDTVVVVCVLLVAVAVGVAGVTFYLRKRKHKQITCKEDNDINREHVDNDAGPEQKLFVDQSLKANNV